VQELLAQRDQALAINEYFAAEDAMEIVSRVEALIGFIGAVEEQVREEIREQAKAVFGSISADIQRLWNVLHSGQQISDVHLHVPDDADKAIDIALTFYGVERQSPRLTLSEGQRNALGLCLFLAMAIQEKPDDHPIILDDVVISLDRDHRSHVAKLLETEFHDRQIILMTHEREWFFELSRFLDRRRWKFERLLPWDSPVVGIRFADQATDFAKARAKIGADPEDAESNVRRIMDQALSEVAERLAVPVPHLRGDENDRRTAGQFMPRIIGRAKKALRVRMPDKSYVKDAKKIELLQTVEPQLAAWANRATHTFSASKSEAETVINNCERALDVFKCESCGGPIWERKSADGTLECRCGELQWKE
jgi:hypothetical protein